MVQYLTELTCHLEELSANAWPAAITQLVDGWQIRFNWQVTHRANSVWPLKMGQQLSLTEKLTLVEAFYHRRQTVACYKICSIPPLHQLDETLAQRGYFIEAATSVQTALIDRVLAQTGHLSDDRLHLSEGFEPAWYTAYCQIEPFEPAAAEIRQGILQRIGPQCGYARLEMAGHSIAVGLGVVERGWLGISCLATRPAFRRQGAAKTILSALMQWGQSHQATRMYLQVTDTNQAGRALYARLGFEPLYHYHYRVQTLPEVR